MSTIGAPLLKQRNAISPDVFNAKTRSMLTGIEIFNLAPTYAGQGVFCTEDGEGFIRNHRYTRDADNTNWIDEGVIVHRHTSELDEDGGSLQMMFIENDRFLRVFPIGMTNEQFHQITQGTGSTINQPAGLELNTGATANGHIDLSVNGMIISISDIVAIFMHYWALHGSRMVVKWGIGLNLIAEAESVTPRFGLEACDNVGTPKNFNQISADNNFWSGEATSVPVSAGETDGQRGLRMEYEPATGVRFYYSSFYTNTRTVRLKTSNVPTGGRWGNRAYKWGWTNTENAEKRLNIYQIQLVGYLPAFYW